MIMDLTATEILEAMAPEKIFSQPDALIIHKEHQQLAAKWHPDRNKDPKADAVLKHINMLHDYANDKLAKGIWEIPGILNLKIKREDRKKSILQIKYLKQHTFELGDFYICKNSVVYLLKAGAEDLVAAFNKSTANFKFSSDRMKEEMKKYLPEINTIGYKKPIISLDSRLVLIVKKNPDQILLQDVVDFGAVEPKHIAWIISGLLNIACYLEYSGQTHNDISFNTLYIAPEFHSVSLYGGWWYSVERGSRLLAIPRRTLNYLPPKVLLTKKASRRTDLELIRVVARELMGDKTGIGSITEIPEAILTWARFPSSGSAKEDYAYWQNTVLPKAFGKRSFTKLSITAEQIYKEL